ncbi:MAG: hypothetical protein WBW48_03450 [Anaerolineae bacterium]
MNSRNKALIIGGLVGSALGVLAAWLYIRAAREEEAVPPQAVPPGKMFKLGLAIMEVLRQVATLGEREAEGQKRGRLRKR